MLNDKMISFLNAYNRYVYVYKKLEIKFFKELYNKTFETLIQKIIYINLYIYFSSKPYCNGKKFFL